MFANRYQFLIWLSIPLLIYSRTEEYQIEITTEEISPKNTENNTATFTSNDNRNKLACNYTNTCGEINSAAKNNSKFPTRLCTCDEKCSTYDQCCSDAKYRNGNRSNFVCVETFFDGNIYMKNVCESAINDRISYLCTDRTIEGGRKNVFFIIPVTSKSTNITYSNFFCALCNNEKEFRFWDLVILSKNRPTSFGLSISQELLHDEVFWNSFDQNFTITAKIPKTLYFSIRHCVSDKIKNCLKEYQSEIEGNCSDMLANNLANKSTNFPKCFAGYIENENITTITAENIPFDHCEKIPLDNSAYRMLCRKNTQKQSVDTTDTELTYIGNCFYQTTDGDLCLINSFFDSHQSAILGSKTIYLYRFNGEFTSSEWVFSRQNNSSVYVCGTEILPSPEDRWFTNVSHSLSAMLISISVIFLILYVILYNNVRKMRYPFSRVIFCYSLTLLATFVIFLINDLLPSCEVIAVILHYFLLSCFTWLMVASFECWRTVTSHTSTKNNKEHTWTRLGIYCLVGWILPITIVSVAVYFELSPIQSIPCTLKPGYGRLKQCFMAQVLPSLYFFHYPSAVMFLVDFYFFAHISVYVFCNSSVHRNFSIFAKLALVTGIPWMFGTLVIFTNAYVFRLSYVIFNSSQGIFIFLVFAYDKELFTDKFNKLYSYFFKKSQPQRKKGEVAYQANNDIHTSRTSINE